MLYQLPNGKCVELSVEQYLALSDKDWELILKDAEASDYGEELNNPFSASVLKHGFRNNAENYDEEDEEDCDDFYESLGSDDYLDMEDLSDD